MPDSLTSKKSIASLSTRIAFVKLFSITILCNKISSWTTQNEIHWFHQILFAAPHIRNGPPCYTIIQFNTGERWVSRTHTMRCYGVRSTREDNLNEIFAAKWESRKGCLLINWNIFTLLFTNSLHYLAIKFNSDLRNRCYRQPPSSECGKCDACESNDNGC